MKPASIVLIFILFCSISYSQIQTIQVSHYLFPEFSNGIILMKSGVKYEKSMNYNSLSEEMVFVINGRKMAMTDTEIQSVDTVYLMEKKFFILNGKFVELVYHSDVDLYAEHRCHLNEPGKPAGYGTTSQTSASTSYSSLQAQGTIYELSLPDDYEVRPYTNYWLKRNGELNKVSNLRQLMKLYSDKKSQCKAYVDEHDVKYNDQESLIGLIKYMQSN